MKKHRVYIIPLIVVIYMLSALTWWAILIFRQNEEIHRLKSALAQSEALDSPALSPDQTDVMESLRAEFEKQKLMVMGEAAFFGLAMIAGIWLIYAAFIKEIRIGKRQTNFLFSVTHEFKSPLSSIKLFLETLRDRELKPNQIQHLAESNYEEAERLESLLNNIILAAKLESGYSFNFESIDGVNLLKKLVDLFKTKYPDFRFQMEGPEELNFKGDSETMYVVFRNLLENSVKYSNTLKSVSINCRRILNKKVIFEISDRGIGIQPNERELVFEKFYRTGSEHTRKTPGTGLGLYLVKYIIDAHEGTISIHKNHPEGTVFKLIFPSKP